MIHALAEDYLRSQVLHHVKSFFSPRAIALASNEKLRFLPFDAAIRMTEPVVAIPTDIPFHNDLSRRIEVSFNGTTLTLWNRVNLPTIGSWECLPNEQNPAWYRNSTGTLIPAWNMFGTLLDLLTFGEEIRDPRRDQHGRFIGAYSQRRDTGFLQVPIFNEAVALIVAALDGLNACGHPHFELGYLVKPPVAVLSHDCDISYGNDAITQSIRALRIFLPLQKLRLPEMSNIWWMISNAMWPRRFYFENNLGMIDLERTFGFKSTFYLLNGIGGRFGARNGYAPISEIVSCIPEGWGYGMHYNYDTFLNPERFSQQKQELTKIDGQAPTSGRAHYLRFDPEKSLPFLCQQGIGVDESSGYPDAIGYRNGIAGAFRALDTKSKLLLDVWELPMVIMDTTIVRQFGNSAIPEFKKIVHHLSRVGGAMSVIFHPGVFHNPEYPEMQGIYHQMLMVFREFGAVSKHAYELALNED